MPSSSNASLSFLPWVRQGVASAISGVDTLGPNQSGVATLSTTLSVNGAALPTVSVRLRGPADVVGIDTHQVLRTDPRPNSADFEPNCFPSIEFDRADFPWLFTPAKADASARLRPWLCLVVVRKQPGVTVSSSVDAPLPALQISSPAKPVDELPDLRDSWGWAHGQAAAGDSSPAQVGQALDGAPELSLSRLVCPRVLAPNTDYIACVVPTFQLGRKAGLGQPILDTELTAAGALAPAWSFIPSAPAQVILPVYYQWEFRTGVGGDFESLARDLKRAVPAGLGQRPINISQPGFMSLPAGTEVQLEAALRPLGAPDLPATWTDSVASEFQTKLAPIVSEPGPGQVADPNADPILAPPLYGRWHAGRNAVTPGAVRWLDQLNLDPRWRSIAAFGTRVVQEHQESLMASAWEQAAELELANQRLRQLQLSLAVGERLHARQVAPLSEEQALRFASPMFGRLRQPSGASLLARQAGSFVPVSATRSAMRRIGRQRGPLTRRLAAQGFARTMTWVETLGMGVNFPPAPPQVEPDFSVLPALSTFQNLNTISFFGQFKVWAEGTAVPSQGSPAGMPANTDVPGFFRAAAIEHLARAFPAVSSTPGAAFTMFQNIKQLIVDQTNPRVTLAALADAVIATNDQVLSPTPRGITPVGVETVMAAPTFPQPMYEALRDISQDLLLPGLDKVEPESVVGLKTNRAFVESFMVGLNFEMARELLWRGYPTDQRGTYFKHFWGNGVPNTAPATICDLVGWANRPLGEAASGAAGEQFVLLLRSNLLRRYPNALIYLVPAASTTPPMMSTDHTREVLPMFSGSMDPDVSFFGFPVSPAEVIGGSGTHGYYVVIQEHPTEPRFGLDVGTPLGTATHLALSPTPPAGVPLNGCEWRRNAAHMAGITRRLPVRLAIHASQLVSLG